MTDSTTHLNTGDGPGRKIGNGVVVAHGVTTAAVAAVVALGRLDPLTGLGAFLAMFAVVFAGDMLIQWHDMSDDTTTTHGGAAPADD